MQVIAKVKQALLGMQRLSWEQGLASHAFLELGEDDLVVVLAREAINRQRQDGRLGETGSDAAVNGAANGEGVLHAFRVTGDTRFRDAAGRQLDYLLHQAPRNADGVCYHRTTDRLFFVDSIYMLCTFLAAAGEYQEALRQFYGHHRYLWDQAYKLYSHLWDDDEQAFRRKAFWGVGNGWVVLSVTRMLRVLPHSMKEERTYLEDHLRTLIASCLRYQRDDGMFHDVLNDPATFPEVNLGQALSYGIYRGVAGGWLDSDLLPRADRMRAVAHSKVDAYGFVTEVCGAPMFDRSGIAPEGQAFFLMMEAAARDCPRA